MGKGKLAKFADMADYPHVFEYPYSVVEEVPFEMKGHWNRDFFGNDRPIVLEVFTRPEADAEEYKRYYSTLHIESGR